MKTNYLSLFVVPVLTLIGFSLTAMAQPGQGPGSRGPAPQYPRQRLPMQVWKEQLGLNAEQQAKLRELNFRTQKAAIDIRAGLQAKRLELQHIISAERPDRAAIDRKIAEISEARSALMKNQVEHRLGMHEILTSEQLAKLAELRAELRERRMERRMERMGPVRPGQVGPPPRPSPPDQHPPLPPDTKG